MKIHNYDTFILERAENDAITEGIIGNIIAGASSMIKGALKGLASPFTNLIKDIKNEWKEGITAEKLRDQLSATILQMFTSLSQQVDKAQSLGEIDQLLSKAMQMNTNMGETIQKQMLALKESWEMAERFQAINEDTQGVARVSMDVAKLFVNRSMSITSQAFKQMIEKAKEGARAGVELNKFKQEIKQEIQKMAGEAKNAIRKIDSKQLIAASKGDKEGARGSGWAQKKAEREAKTYEPNTKAQYLNNKGEKVTGLVKKDLGKQVEFLSATGDGTTFKKDKQDVLGPVTDDRTAPAAYKVGDWVQIKAVEGKPEEIGKISTLDENDCTVIVKGGRARDIRKQLIEKKVEEPEWADTINDNGHEADGIQEGDTIEFDDRHDPRKRKTGKVTKIEGRGDNKSWEVAEPGHEDSPYKVFRRQGVKKVEHPEA